MTQRPTGTLHVEAAWARFRNSPGGALLRQSLSLRGSYLASIGVRRLPAEVTLPGAIPWNLLATAEADARGEDVGPHLSTEVSFRQACVAGSHPRLQIVD